MHYVWSNFSEVKIVYDFVIFRRNLIKTVNVFISVLTECRYFWMVSGDTFLN